MFYSLFHIALPHKFSNFRDMTDVIATAQLIIKCITYFLTCQHFTALLIQL